MSRRVVSVYILTFIFLMSAYGYHQMTFTSNLDDNCLHCLCIAASKCRTDLGCEEGFCGPFQISENYWTDATESTTFSQMYDIKNYSICANDYFCAVKIVKLYLSKYAQDCNKNGVTDCLDYGMISYNAGPYCKASLHKTPESKIYGDKLIKCTGHEKY